MLITVVVRAAPYTGAACGGRLSITTTNTFSAAGQGPKHGKYHPVGWGPIEYVLIQITA
jgi:hypothetical protein